MIMKDDAKCKEMVWLYGRALQRDERMQKWWFDGKCERIVREGQYYFLNGQRFGDTRN